MKTILVAELEQRPELYSQVADYLDRGALVCLPSPTGYKLANALDSPTAITALWQAKRRIKNAPALVFVPDRSWVGQLAAEVHPSAERLMAEFWPGPVTLLFKASDSLHPKVRKPLTKAKGWLGVRMPEGKICLDVLQALGRPLLVTSANLAHKKGAESIAQVKKNFGRTVELLIDDGDISTGPSSTLVDATRAQISVVRSGAVPAEQIERFLAG